MLFFILFVLPYIVGFVALAFWRQGWTLGGNRRDDGRLFLFHRIGGWPRRVRGGGPSSCPRGRNCSRAGNQHHFHDLELSMGYIVAAMFPLGYVAGYTVFRYF